MNRVARFCAAPFEGGIRTEPGRNRGLALIIPCRTGPQASQPVESNAL